MNGYKGIDYTSDSFDGGQLLSIVRFLACSGVTQHLPTITTAPQSRIIRFIEKIKKASKEDYLVRHAVPGLHLEGPYISSQDGPRGTHDVGYVRNPSLKEFHEWYEASDGLLSIVTLAPELPGAIELIKEITSLGILASIGHTAASSENILEAIRAGARLSTHLGNGSAINIPRLKNFLWPQLVSDALYASIISDGDHLPPEVVEVLRRCKGLNRLILVSDVAPFGGYPKGRYAWGNVSVEVFQDGHIGLPDSEILAGATHLLDWDIQHFIHFTNSSLVDAIRLCTENPSNLINLKHTTFNFSVGDPADLVQFRYENKSDSLKIIKTIINGELIFPL